MDPAEDLRRLGYEYRGGRLLAVDSDTGFQFRDQAHYDLLADAVLRYVGVLLEVEGRLRPLVLPLGATTGPRCPIYVSEGFENAQKLLLLIQGSGRVRVGVWGCALCINKDLDHGTMIPYIKRATADGYGVIVLNPNENEVDREAIPGSEDPARHVAYVWENIVQPQCPDTAQIDIVAHSNGGRAMMDFLSINPSATGRIRRVVLTDSYHHILQVEALAPEVDMLLRERTVNFVPSDAPFGTRVASWVSLGNHMNVRDKGCPCVSAATQDHATTNHAALDAAFDFFAAPERAA